MLLTLLIQAGEELPTLQIVEQIADVADKIGATVVLIVIIWLFIKGKIVSQEGVEFTVRRMVRRMNGHSDPDKPNIVEIRPYCPEDDEEAKG